MESVQKKEGPKTVDNDLHGEWMIVARKKGNPIISKDHSRKGSVNNKINRYDGIQNVLGNANQEVNQGYGKMVYSSPKDQGPSSVKDPKVWVKPKKHRHDQGPHSFTVNQASTSKTPVKNLFSTEPKSLPNKINMVLNTPRDNQDNVVQHVQGDGSALIRCETSMNIEQVDTNHFKFMDEPKPPD